MFEDRGTYRWQICDRPAPTLRYGRNRASDNTTRPSTTGTPSATSISQLPPCDVRRRPSRRPDHPVPWQIRGVGSHDPADRPRARQPRRGRQVAVGRDPTTWDRRDQLAHPLDLLLGGAHLQMRPDQLGDQFRARLRHHMVAVPFGHGHRTLRRHQRRPELRRHVRRLHLHRLHQRRAHSRRR